MRLVDQRVVSVETLAPKALPKLAIARDFSQVVAKAKEHSKLIKAQNSIANLRPAELPKFSVVESQTTYVDIKVDEKVWAALNTKALQNLAQDRLAEVWSYCGLVYEPYVTHDNTTKLVRVHTPKAQSQYNDLVAKLVQKKGKGFVADTFQRYLVSNITKFIDSTERAIAR